MPQRKRRRLLWQLFPTYVFVIGLSLVASAWYGANAFSGLYKTSLERNLEARARMVEQAVDSLPYLDERHVDPLCKSLGELTSTRITVILPDGNVIGDSQSDPSQMENHGIREEFLKAIETGTGTAVRDSATVHREMMYVAVSHDKYGKPEFVVRTAISVSEVRETLNRVYSRVAIWGLIVLALAALLSVYLTRRATKQIELLREGAERYASGDLERDIEMPSQASVELAVLADALSRMAGELKRRIETSERERAELSTVLTAMVEGVIAVDRGGKIITLNPAAAALIETYAENAIGRTIFEVARHPDLQRFVTRVLNSGEAMERELTLTKDSDRTIKLTGIPLTGANGGASGALFVMDDVTRLRRLENVRRDFVANVSHELKTPITSIKGFVETLLDGAIDDEEARVRFLEIVKKQSDRLQAIIEDLLELARVEEAAEARTLEFEIVPIRTIAVSAIEDCRSQALEAGIEISLDCYGDISAPVNAPLLELALVNLIDNAIKYGGASGRVKINCDRSRGNIVISVSDEGPGIPKEHLDRLFERFYRVDRARSREIGGTGLGLAIVKHIALAHGGGVSVESVTGIGSTFSISLPASQNGAA